MFRRRKSGGQDLAAGDVAEYPANPEYPGPGDDEQVRVPQGEPRADGGPWDAAEPYPARERVDLGSLLVPVGPDHEIQLVMAEQHGAWVTVRHAGSELQVQAFAAPRSGALWDEVRAEIAAELQAGGGRCAEAPGTFGVALDADVPAEPGNPASGLRRVRFIGVDGPRWFLRGLLSGPAAAGGDARLIEDVFGDIVVVRGEHPVPPRDLLELRLPPQAQQAIAEQMAGEQGEQEQSRFATDLNPFQRGPEFTETR